MLPHSNEGSERFSGEVLRIVYRRADNDWSVLEVCDEDSDDSRILVGYSACQPGQMVEANGRWVRDARFGHQFQATEIVASTPSNEAGIATYLSSGVLPGVGPRVAKDMLAAFGTDVLDVLDNAPHKLQQVRGIGPAKLAGIINSWSAERTVRQIMIFLHSQSLSAALCRRIYKAYGEESVEVIQSNPYRLCVDVRGIGFKTVDAIGAKLAIPATSPHRIRAGLMHVMEDRTTQGHCGVARDEFVAAVADTLEVTADHVAPVLDELLTTASETRTFVLHEGIVYDYWLALSEADIAGGVAYALARPPDHLARVNDRLIERAAEACGMTLAPRQWDAVKMALTHGVSVITGGPGCGKTATLQVLLEVFRRLHLQVSLVAPTGKAAQRASQATGCEAKTVHRLLGIRNMLTKEDSHIHADVVVIDESSMMDVRLMAKLVRALDDKTNVVMVGDVDQLPSVGPGRVLADAIDSGQVPVTVLDQVFRQAAGSAIITNAHAINAGRAPSSAGREGDFFVLSEQHVPALRHTAVSGNALAAPSEVAAAVADEVIRLVGERLPAKYNMDPIIDIQVLAPMNGGECGVQALNERLQNALNPSPAQWVKRGGTRFGMGDKVIQVRNNYDLDIFNGDVGLVEAVSDTDEVVRVMFDGRLVSIPFDSLRDLRLAYAMTIHKSQGSQSPAVVIPLVTQHWMMLQRNLLYTGVTRASRLAVLVCQTKALQTAVRTTTSARRVTRLSALLTGECGARRPASVASGAASAGVCAGAQDEAPTVVE